MSKFTCLVLCAVVVRLSSVYVLASEEEKAAFREAIKPIVTACSEQEGVSFDELQSAKKAGSPDGIKPCFFGCVFKKAEIFNDKGEYDVDKGLSKLEKFVSNPEKRAQFADIGKKCASVNEKAVSDGEAGCERGLLLTSCFLENRGEILI